MSTPINDGGPAFPRLVSVENPMSPRQMNITQGSPLKATTTEGMSLRDYFAGQALAGLLASQIHGMTNVPSKGPFARLAFDAADAMLAEKSKGTQEHSHIPAVVAKEMRECVVAIRNEGWQPSESIDEMLVRFADKLEGKA